MLKSLERIELDIFEGVRYVRRFSEVKRDSAGRDDNNVIRFLATVEKFGTDNNTWSDSDSG